MDITRREFVKAVAAAAVLPAVGSSSPAYSVNRQNMWSPDRTSEETLARCDRLLATNPEDVLALVHRGQIPVIYFDQKQAWADLSRAISLESANPCMYYIRGVCFDRAEDLRHAISLLSTDGEATGTAICSSSPDYYRWQGTEPGELRYMSLLGLGCTLEERGDFEEAIVAYEKAAAVESISTHDLETWAEASFAVESYCLALVGYDRLIAIEPRAEFVRRREECWAAIRQ